MTDLLPQLPSDALLALAQLQEEYRAFRTRERPPTAIQARVYNSGALTIANNTATIPTFDSERWDTDTMHSTSANTSRLTCQTAGLYLIIGHISWAASAVGRRVLSILLNGATTLATDSRMPVTDAAIPTRQTCPAMYRLAAGDYVELQVLQLSGGNLNIESAANFSPEFSMVLIA